MSKLSNFWARKVTKEQLLEALEESVFLQSHYARLLNSWDEGKRLTFADAKAWLERLAYMKRQQEKD